jgi:hypothetical protein
MGARAQGLDPNGGDWRRWYQLERWRKTAKAQLRKQPLCEFCLARGVVTIACIADHIEPHHGDWNSFWLGRLQSLCKDCHDSNKRLVQERGYDPKAIGQDGWPTDPRHPANKQALKSVTDHERTRPNTTECE